VIWSGDVNGSRQRRSAAHHGSIGPSSIKEGRRGDGDDQAIPQLGDGLDPRNGRGLHAAGVMDKQTMRKFDDVCLTPGEIRALREC
jgi:hypothetical protein